MSQALGNAGVVPLEAAQIERAMKPVFNPRNSQEKDHYEIHRSTDGHFHQLIYWPKVFRDFEYVTVRTSTGGPFIASRMEIPHDETLAGVSGDIHESLEKSMANQGVPREVIYRLADIFGWRIDFLTEPREGDVYKIVWRRYLGKSATRDGEIISALYRGKETGEVYAFRLAGDYFDQGGESLRGEFLRAPLQYRRISSYFTEHRYHPILKFFRPHHGIDYAAPFGTPASSIADGVVIAKGWEGGLGNELRVRHAGSYVSIYGHLSGYPRGIHVGAHVKQGQVIGYVGSTGMSTGPHLHFGFERDGRLINFFSLKMKNSRKSVPLPERPHFEKIKKNAQVLFDQLAKPGAPLQVLKPAS